MVSYLQKMASGHLAKNANGHLVNNCGGECEGKYKLTHCVACSNTDCDGSESPIYTDAAHSNITAAMEGKVVKYDNKCWTVGCGEGTISTISVTGPYDRCGYDSDYPDDTYCCDICYTCGDCEFHPDSTVTVSYDYCYIDWCCDWGSPRTLSDCFDSNWLFNASQLKVSGVTANKTGCSTWTAEDVTISYYNRMSQPNNSCPQPLVTKTGIVTVTYNCGSNEWSLAIDDDSRSLFSSLCGNTPSQNNCSGYSFSTSCCDDKSTPAYNEFVYHNYSASITVNNNDCGAAGP